MSTLHWTADYAPLPNPPKWARDRVDAICGGSDMTDDMANVSYLRLAEYVARIEGPPELTMSELVGVAS